MVHIVFEQSNVEALKKAIGLDETLQGDVIEIRDDFAVGPLAAIYETEGFQQRRDWWKMILEFSSNTDQPDIVDDTLTVYHLLKRLDEEPEEQVWIWMGQNAHDVCSYYWLMSQLKAYQGRIQVLYLNNLPFINEKGSIFYPTSLSEIQPKEFLKAKKLARPITLSEFEVDTDEWKKLCSENALVRFLEGGKKLVSKEPGFYDRDILNIVNFGPQRLLKLLSIALNKMKVKTGDAFLAWRIREMALEGKLELVGDWTKNWKDITVKLPGGNGEIIEITEAG